MGGVEDDAAAFEESAADRRDGDDGTAGRGSVIKRPGCGDATQRAQQGEQPVGRCGTWKAAAGPPRSAVAAAREESNLLMLMQEPQQRRATMAFLLHSSRDG